MASLVPPPDSDVPDYHEALDVAIAAAQQAGELLRAELHRPGGPRGTERECPADREAERVIRARLLAAFPLFGVVGEELPAENRAALDPAKHVWLIDPNDGTQPFHMGYRGSSVSIALLRRGVPVLGVVLAYSAPDDDGDLITWAEGCGSVYRNGRAVERSWPDELSSEVTILVTHHADDRPELTSSLIAPARFRAVPSIAYRLALVGVGEGDLAVSLNQPASFDVGAGHAILRGAGGDLFHERGEVRRYGLDGSSSGNCIGGVAWLVKQLLEHERASELFGRRLRSIPAPSASQMPPAAGSSTPRPPSAELFSPVRPVRGRLLRNSSELTRAQGCLLGQLAGDALGSLVEFQRPVAIRQKFPKGVRTIQGSEVWDTLAGQPTDDSELALMLARSLVAEGGYDKRKVLAAYVAWLHSAPFDCGSTIRAALQAAMDALGRGADPLLAVERSAIRDSQANGALMRLSPLAIFGAGTSPERVVSWARVDAQLTHPHLECQEANAAFAFAIAHAIASGAHAREVYDATLDWSRKNLSSPSIVALLQRSETQAPSDYNKHEGWVHIAFSNAFYQLLHAPSAEEGLVATVAEGGDSDTNAAIAGALLGAVHGLRAWPTSWIDRVLSCRPLEAAGARRPRPQMFWPTDALVLAERLLLAGHELSG